MVAAKCGTLVGLGVDVQVVVICGNLGENGRGDDVVVVSRATKMITCEEGTSFILPIQNAHKIWILGLGMPPHYWAQNGTTRHEQQSPYEHYEQQLPLLPHACT